MVSLSTSSCLGAEEYNKGWCLQYHFIPGETKIGACVLSEGGNLKYLSQTSGFSPQNTLRVSLFYVRNTSCLEKEHIFG